MERLFRFWNYLNPYRVAIIMLFLCIMGSIVIQVPIPLLQKEIIDSTLPSKNVQRLIVLVVSIIGLYGTHYLFEFLRNSLSIRVRQKVLTLVRMDMYSHLQRMPPQYFAHRQSGSLLSRILSDVEYVQHLANDEFFLLVSSVVKTIVIVVLLFKISITLTLLCACVIPIIVLIFFLFRTATYRNNKLLLETQAFLSGKIQENLASMKLIQTESLQTFKGQETENYCKQLEQVAIKRGNVGISGNFLMAMLSNLPLFGIILGMGGFLVIKETLTIGSLLAFMQYIFSIVGPITLFFKFHLNLQAGFSALDRIYEVLDKPPNIADVPSAEVLHNTIDRITFKDVSLTYDNVGGTDQKVTALSHINIAINKGNIIGVVGPSGGGKTSFVNMLLRFYSPCTGQIMVNSKSIESYTIKSIREKIAYIPQEEYLFNDTVRKNLTFDRNYSQKELDNALSHAQAYEFVYSLENGIDTLIGERGTTLSGGQRQRIILARAFLKNPDLYIFDEAFSALDTAAAKAIRNILMDYLHGKTAIIISHQFSFLELVDRIVVFDSGKIVQDGSFEHLVKEKGVFQRLYSLQNTLL